MLSRNLTLSAFFRVAILAYKIRGVRLQTSISILKGTRKREFANLTSTMTALSKTSILLISPERLFR